MKYYRSIALAACAFLAAALSSQTLSPVPWINVQFTDQAGHPLSNGKVYTCAASTSCPGNPIPSYTTSSGFTANSNPVQLDSAGRAAIWLSPGIAYRFVVTTSSGVVVLGAGGDNIVGASSTTSGGGGGGGGSGTPGGSTTNVQFNLLGAFAGSGNFTWNNTTRTLTLTGVAGTPSLVSAAGFIQSSGGFLSSVTGGSWQGFNTNTDGSLFRAYAVAQNTSNNAGGYIALAPITYNPHNGSACTDIYGNAVQQPMPLNGLSNFGTNDALIWVGTSPVMPSGGSCGTVLPVNTTNGLNTNTFIFARGGFATDRPAYNSIQSLEGGAYLKLGLTTDQAVYPKAYNLSTSLNNPAAGYGGFAYKGGNNYWYYNSTSAAWATVDLSSIGGGATPGGATTNVQYNNAGAFGGSANMTWNNAGHLFTVTALNATSAGMAVGTGFMQADKGFLATPAVATLYNSFYAPSGGMAALSFTAVNYTNVGSSSGAPSPTSGDTINPGAQYCDTGTSPCVPKVWNGVAWVSLATGGATSPGGANTNVQFNSAGSFGGSANLTYAAQLLNSVASSSSTAGMSVSLGFMQAENGFLAAQFAVPGTALNFNVIQAPTGGMAAKSFTATTYVQLGTHNSGGVGTGPTMTTGDSPHPGACSWDTFGSGSLKCYDGIAWSVVGGSGGTPGIPVTSVQYNGGSGFAGTPNFVWDNALRRLTVTTAGATAGIAVGNGFIQSDTGFLATLATATAFNSIQAPGGGMAAKSFTATKYVNTGNNNGIPALTSGDSFNSGALYCDTATSPCVEKLWNGSAWVSLLSNGVQSINALNGVLILQGTANQVNVVSGGSTVTFSTPQSIATSSSVTFAQMTAAVVGASIGFQNGNGNFAVNGNGDISTVGVVSANGAGGGVNVPTNTAYNAIQAASGGVASKTAFVGTSALPSADPVPNASLTVYNGTATFPGELSIITNSLATSKRANIFLSSYSGASANLGGVIAGIAVRGTLTSPTATQAGDILLSLNGSGWTTALTGGSAVINMIAGSNWTPSSVESFMQFQVAPSGGTATEAMRLASTGALWVARTTDDSTGAKVQVNGQVSANSLFLVSETPPSVAPGGQFRVYGDSGGTLRVSFNGGAYASLATGGIASLNGLTGALTIAGTTNQITVTPAGATITLSTPQSIGTASAVNFSTVTTSSFVASSASGASLAFQAGGGAFQVSGAGAISTGGVVTSSAGVNVTTTTATNSIQTSGGINVTLGGTFGSSVALNGGFVQQLGTNAQVQIGTGNFYTRYTGASSAGIGCIGISDGWLALTSDDFVVVCIGGARFRAALTSY